MQLKTCRHCKKFFNAIFNETLCPNCKDELETIYKEVKAYVQDNKGVSIMTVVQHFDSDFVTERQVREWVKEDRLQFSGEYTGIFCRHCGRVIESGDLCADCKAKLVSELDRSLKKPVKTAETKVVIEKEKPKMRYFH